MARLIDTTDRNNIAGQTKRRASERALGGRRGDVRQPQASMEHTSSNIRVIYIYRNLVFRCADDGHDDDDQDDNDGDTNDDAHLWDSKADGGKGISHGSQTAVAPTHLHIFPPGTRQIWILVSAICGSRTSDDLPHVL